MASEFNANSLGFSLLSLTRAISSGGIIGTVAHRTVGRRPDTLYPRMEWVRFFGWGSENALSSRCSVRAHCRYVRSPHECPPAAPARRCSSSSGAAPGADRALPASHAAVGYQSRKYLGGCGERCRPETGRAASAVRRPRNRQAATASRQRASAGSSRPVARACVAERWGRGPPGDFAAGDPLAAGARGGARPGAVFWAALEGIAPSRNLRKSRRGSKCVSRPVG